MDCLIVLAYIQGKSLRIEARPLAIMSPLWWTLLIKDGNLELISPICIAISRPLGDVVLNRATAISDLCIA